MRKVVTILFCDLASSTALAERLEPEALRRVLERYYAVAREALERHGGTVEKFIGDAVMGVFGIPVLHEDDALRAVRAAFDLRESVSKLNVDLSVLGVELVVRIGVNTGEVIAGTRPGEALVTGDPVVTAKRLEEAAPPGGILIGPKTQALVEDAVAVEPVESLALKGKASPSRGYLLLEVRAHAEGRARRIDSPLVGRDTELAALQSAFDEAVADGSARVVTVLGAAGAGKTRLVRELCAAVPQARVLRGRCLPYGEGITWWPVLEIVREAAGLTGGEPQAVAHERIGALLEGAESPERLSAGISAALGLAEEVPVEELFWAVRTLLEELARTGPLLLILDDLHWAEPSFLDLVEYLGARGRGVPALLCCLARPELLELRPHWAIPRPETSLVALHALGPQDSGALVANLLGGDLPPVLRERVLVAAGGNPLFVEELLRMLIDDGVLRREGSAWEYHAEPGRLHLPPTIGALLSARIDRLAPDERRVVEHAAVIGERFSWGDLSGLMPPEAGQSLGALLQRLVQKELIHPSAGMGDEDEFRFGHILIRDAAYALLPKDVRAVLHERAARLIDARVAGKFEVDEIGGYHLEQASQAYSEIDPFGGRGRELAAEAAARLEAAGQRAAERGESRAAVSLLERTHALCPPDDPRRATVLLDLADALFLTGRLEEAAQRLEESQQLAIEVGDEAIAGWAELDSAFLRWYTNPDEGTDALLEVASRSAELFERVGEGFGLAEALRITGDVYWIRCEIGEMQRVLERALDVIDAAGRIEQGRIRSALARAAMFGPTNVEDGLRLIDDLQSRLGEDRSVAALIDCFAAYLEALAGRFDAARARLARARGSFVELGKQLLLFSQCLFAGQVELLAGEPVAAEAHLREGYELLESLGERGNLAGAAAHLALALQAQGRNDAAEPYAEEAARLGSPDDAELQVVWRIAQSRIRAANGSAAEAVALAEEAVGIAERTDAPNLRADANLALAHALAAEGREYDARRAAQTALSFYEAKGNVVGAGAAGGLLAVTAG
jgi:class 3 adenylate cyclase/tetratricopeptide (TPR) repeat protein